MTKKIPSEFLTVVWSLLAMMMSSSLVVKMLLSPICVNCERIETSLRVFLASMRPECVSEMNFMATSCLSERR